MLRYETATQSHCVMQDMLTQSRFQESKFDDFRRQRLRFRFVFDFDE
jgi:hypothetical protein